MLAFDSHVHLNSPRFNRDAEQVWERAIGAGVGAAVVVGYDIASSRRAIELSRDNKGLFAAVGIHPHSSDESTTDAMAELALLAEDPAVVAIGETGLDSYRNIQSGAVQKSSFKSHLRLAADSGLPVIVHVRDAFDDALQCLRDYEGVGVIHCYTGGPSELAGFLERGLYISFSGVITYASEQMVREAAKIVPADRLLVETDCPYLAPAPDRRKRNEPAYLVQVLERMAQIRDESID
ncbi:MAG: TatD family hydrolase, partial [Candidatus Hydrogenedentes bacterium]|nr:TatD family hydrolase [Candidatus Hydrogenedentota bacterium]